MSSHGTRSIEYKGSNYYRCRFSAGRGNSAADAAGHPRVLQIKEDTLLQAVLGFMDHRLFGPERLELLRNELVGRREPRRAPTHGRAESLQAELNDIDQSLYRQSLRMEEHEDWHHPVIALVKKRIAELSARRETVLDAMHSTEAQHAEISQPHQIETLLAAIPDLRPTLKAADLEELTEILAAFDITVARFRRSDAPSVCGCFRAFPWLFLDPELRRCEPVDGLAGADGRRLQPGVLQEVLVARDDRLRIP